MVYLHSLQSEWLKTKRSISFWLCIIGGFFIPFLYLLAFLYNKYSINTYPDQVNIWQLHYNQLWQNMVTFLLPMGVVLSSSLITQLEFKNNTWKQVNTTPQSYATVFFAKLSVIILMTLQFFLFFNIGIVLSAVIPTLIFDGALPKQAFPFMLFLKGNARIFVTCLPIIAVQYLISLKYKNFLVPVGIGMLVLIGSLIATGIWKYAWLSPFSYSIMNVMTFAQVNVPINFYGMATIYFVVVTAISYYLYINRKEKG